MSPLSWRQWIKNCVAARKLPRANVSRKRRQTRVLLTLEGLEDRITPSNVSWTGADNNLSWSDGKNWSNGLVPTSSDDVTISKTVNGTIGIGAGSYAVHSLNDTTAALSIASGGTLSLAAAAATSTFDYNVTVNSGGTLSVGAGAKVNIGSGATLSDDGTLTFGSGATATFNPLLGASQIVVDNDGLMSASGATFDASNNLSISQIVVKLGELKASNCNFTISKVDLTDSSVVKSGDLTGNTFNTTLYTPIADVPLLTNNQSFDNVDINPGDSLSSGQTVTLTLMGTQSHANLVYVLAGNLTIKTGATLTVAANVSLDIGAGTLLSSLTLTDDGLLTFASGDTVTFNNLGLAQIVVGTGGEMKANDTVFNNASTLSPGQIVLTDGSVVKTNDLTNNIFNVSLYTPIGDVKFLTNNQSFDDVYINAGDSLSSGQSATLTAMGTVSSANLVYILAGDFTIKTGATLTVGANVSLDIGMPSDLSLVTLTDDGLLTFASGDTVTFSNLGPSQIVVGTGGEMKANGTVFNNANSLSTSQIVVQSGGQLVATGSNITVTNLSNAGSVNLTNSTLTVSGTVSQLSGTSLTAGTWIIAAGSSLDLASTVNITTLTGANVTLSGASSNFAALANLDSISASSSFSLLAGLNFTTAGDLSNAGTVTVVGDTLKVTGNLSNTGAINLSSGTLSVAGSVAQLSSSHALTAGRWTVGPHSNLNFASGSSITSLAGSQVTLNGATSNFAALASLNTIAAGSIFSLLGGRSFTTAGDLSSAGGIILNTATLNVSGNLTNTGGLIWTNATVNVAGNLSNTGRLNLNGSTLTVKGTVAQLSANALTAGTWNIGPSSNLNFAAGSKITSLAGAQVTLNGATSNFAALASLNTIAKGSSLSLLGGRSFTTAGNFTNNGSLTIGAGSVLTASGSFSQASTASLSVQLGGSNSAPTIGRVVSTTGTVTLGGTLHLTSTVVPAVGTSFEVLANEGGSAISGTFAGLAEGGTFLVTSGSTTMTFQISYKGDGGNNVTITRIS